MRVLIVKTSSMGDVIHTLPALTDASRVFPSIQFDWVVEEGFSIIPSWHPFVDKVIPVAIRRWRKKLFSKTTLNEWKQFRVNLQKTHYDIIIDAQGLIKSAFLTANACGKQRAGLNRQSARESLSSLFYQKKYSVDKKQHAITRVRELFAKALHYPVPTTIADYGIDRNKFVSLDQKPNYLVFLHGTTWSTKHWPEQYWIELTKIANQAGQTIKLFWGNEEEHQRANRIASACEKVEVLPRLDLTGIAKVLSGANAVVAVDTGLGHLAAAFDIPTISIYGPTDPVLTGTQGRLQKHLAAKFPCSPCLSRECTFKDHSSLKLENPLYPPCFTDLTPLDVWRSVEMLL